MEEDFVEGRGRSAKKRAAQEVEKLAQQLAELSDKAAGELPMSDDLRPQLEQALTTRGHSSRRRAVKHLAGLLRRDPDLCQVLEEHLAGVSAAHWEEQARFHQLEKLRDRLCSQEEAAPAITELMARVPDLDGRELRRLSRSACHGDRSAARKIFRLLRQILTPET